MMHTLLAHDHPRSIDSWPEHTTVSPTDVCVCGVSLLRLVDWCGTPCVHNAAAVIPGSDGEVSEDAMAAVVVATVVDVSVAASGSVEVLIDADLDGCLPILDECRMIGRTSSSARFEMQLTTGVGSALRYRASRLPGDLCAGDLIAIPCAGVVVLHDVRLPRG
jgi:hypothetical protein